MAVLDEKPWSVPDCGKFGYRVGERREVVGYGRWVERVVGELCEGGRGCWEVL